MCLSLANMADPARKMSAKFMLPAAALCPIAEVINEERIA